MSVSPVPASSDNNDAFEREHVIYVNDPGDTTVRPVSPTSLRIRERDHEQIAALLVWAEEQQKELIAARRRMPRSDAD